MVISGLTSLPGVGRVLGQQFWNGLARMVGGVAPVVHLSHLQFGEELDLRPGVLLIGLADSQAAADGGAAEIRRARFALASSGLLTIYLVPPEHAELAEALRLRASERVPPTSASPAAVVDRVRRVIDAIGAGQSAR